jgi:hypothetical protein
LVQTLAVCSSTQKNWGQGTKACLAQGSNHDVTWLVTISVPVLGEVPELLSGGCSPMESAKSTEKEVLGRILFGFDCKCSKDGPRQWLRRLWTTMVKELKSTLAIVRTFSLFPLQTAFLGK